MINTLIDWLKKFFIDVGEAFSWLTSKPFANSGITGIENFTPLMLITLSGLIVFVGFAIVKWVIS